MYRADLDDFVVCYNPENRHERKETERFKSFAYDDLIKRDKVSLDIFWAKLPGPDVIAAEIVDNLQAGLDQLRRLLPHWAAQNKQPRVPWNWPGCEATTIHEDKQGRSEWQNSSLPCVFSLPGAKVA